MSYDRTERIRRAAILVASLEQSLAEEMLGTLPPHEAERIAAEVERLDEVDVEEQQDVLEEFRRMTRRGAAPAEAVEFTYSAPISAYANGVGAGAAAAGNAEQSPPAAEPVRPLHDADVHTIAMVLADEHPQTIAAALSRLDAEQSAAVFAALPGELQVEVLDRVARLQPADEAAVLDVESQLVERLRSHRERRERAAAGVELARRLITRTSPLQQAALSARIPAAGGLWDAPTSPAAPRDAFRPTATESPAPSALHAQPAQQAAALASAVERARQRDNFQAVELELSGSAAGYRESSQQPASTDLAADNLLDRSHELESLSDDVLLAALRAADEQTVQRALAASSDQFVKRIYARLPRRQAGKLRKMLRALGPTRLADLRNAQIELLRLADAASAPLAHAS